MNKDIANFLHSFNEVIKDGEMLRSIARASDLQLEACRKLEQKMLEIREEKERAIEKQDEDYANCLLGCECSARTVLAELRMWLLLKQEEPEKAWDELINAQDSLLAAMRAHRGFSHLSDAIKRLAAIEDLVFPPQIFMSAGVIVRTQLCSVCGSDYEDCDHLAGRPYMGKFCVIVAGDLAADQVAIVEKPADKRCRVVDFETDGGHRNRMTWKLEKRSDSEPASKEPAPSSDEPGLKVRAIIMRAD
jgi:hypothetical protein